MNDDIALFMQSLGVSTKFLPYIYCLLVFLTVVFVIYVSRLLCHRGVIPLVRTLTRKTQTGWDDTLFNDKVLHDICNLVPPLILTIFIPVFFVEDNRLNIICVKLCNMYITVITVKLICSILSSLYIIFSEHEKLKNRALQGIFQMLKLIVVCVGIIIIISNLLDKDPVNIIAGFGASAAILMLVFKDTIMGLVAGVQLSINDMLRPGDWITLPKFGADGVVIEITLTTVKVQNWDKTITTIPPYSLVSDSFQNWRGMWNSGGRRIKRSIYIDMNSITFCTKEQNVLFASNGWLDGMDKANEFIVNLQVFRNYIEVYLRNHPKVNNEMMVMVRQLQPTPQGLPLELYFFFDGTEWVPYENLQSEVFEHLFAILPSFGLRVFQSPAGSDFSNHVADVDIVEKNPKKRTVKNKKTISYPSESLF